MRKLALVIGVEEYGDPMISRLKYAQADALGFAGRLRDRCGFDHVRVLTDSGGDGEPTLQNILLALRDLSGELRQDDLFLFFFAGHGVERDSHAYLLARDSMNDYPDVGSLPLERLRSTFARLRVQRRVLILDACRNSPEASRSDTPNRMGDVMSRDVMAAASSAPETGATTVLLSACESGQRAYEWASKGHGVLTHYLLEGIDGAAWRSSRLEIDDLAMYTASQVLEWSSNTLGERELQRPWYEKVGLPQSIVIAEDSVIGGMGSTWRVEEETQQPTEAPEPNNSFRPTMSLHKAARWGNLEQIRQHVANGADVNAKNEFGHTALHEAAYYGQTEAIKALIQAQADISAKSRQIGETPLHFAAMTGQVKAMNVLIRAGADVNAKSKTFDFTPLHNAARDGHTEAIKALIQANADVNAKDMLGGTPLHNAATDGHTEAIKALIQANADVNAKDMLGGTPLQNATEKLHAKAIEVLRRHGAR